MSTTEPATAHPSGPDPGHVPDPAHVPDSGHPPDPLPEARLSQPLAAGLVTAVVGFSSSFVLVLSGLRAVGADPRQAVSGLLLLCLAMGGLAIWFGLRHRQPVSIAWSTPGAALLVNAGHQHGGYRYAIGAFLISGLLITLTGLWQRLGRWVAAIPAPLATALLSGVLLPLCLAPVRAADQLPALALPSIAAWAVLTRSARRWATPGALLTAFCALLLHHSLHLGHADSLLPAPTWTAPAFSVGAVVSIALPLYVITMASQNIPGVAVLTHFGYRPRTRPILLGTGLATTAGSFGGLYMVNLAAITAALSAGPDAHPDRGRRWIASVTAGTVYLVLGLAAGLSAALLTAAPPLLVEATAGLALLGTLGSALVAALADERSREAAVITIAVCASGVSAFGIGSPVWALLAGLAAYGLLRRP
ncbi:benzoate/H(+) symporter BenE family transporter [Streptacidiphilus sp. PB12-B1b]|uniref:benzoate/H(+) symporter BenE family transporter n=1 Tax=Streptacidiphilus sp. PB12-B1b TaxID=2705012 RepID=UPI0015F94B7C|nr:benzoate/H(+) symporter BenE family transporter [Streptacidiphilus sp. PB12-B1b]QMU78779.1 benzoate/H(+) symporter BenE family transporter [Streptacidiphilus sp. PB12-B1b]